MGWIASCYSALFGSGNQIPSFYAISIEVNTIYKVDSFDPVTSDEKLGISSKKSIYLSVDI